MRGRAHGFLTVGARKYGRGVRFGVLGPLAVWTRDGRPVRVPEVKVRALLAGLLVEPGRAVSVDRLVEDLWGERRPRDPANSLQTKVSQLRRALEAAEPGGRALVVRQPPGYALRAGDDAVDAQRFGALAARGMAATAPAARAALLAEAVALWRGPVLADFADEPFAVALHQRLEQERLVVVEEWARARLALGEHAALAAELGEWVARHPLHEGLRGVHMQALHRAGRQADALASYAELRTVLADELGLDPSPELAALRQEILVRRIAVIAPPRSNLPAPLHPLVGRADAVRAVGTAIGAARLVTLTGPGGVGKTSLALAAARAEADEAWFVEFSGLAPSTSDDERVVAVVAAALGVREEAGPGAAAARLGQALAARRMLLVLDNCEQVVGPVARIAAGLLRAAPQLRIVATSREPLGVAGEVVWSVPALEVPGAATLRAPDVLAVAERFSAVQLFVERARAAAPGFALDAGNARAVATICARLDGIPLALELAATKVRALGVHELLRRLDDRFRLLAAGRRDVPVRQRTLRAVIDWSWELLAPAEQAVLRRLAVPADGCSLEAAEALCAGDGVAAEEVLGIVTGLVERSLVVGQPGVEPRFRLLETVAAYGLQRLRESGELPARQVRHAEFLLGLARRAMPGLRGEEQRRWLERLDAETPNLRAALDGAVGRGDAAFALRLVDALAWYWFLRGRFGEAVAAFDAAAALPGAGLGAERAVVAAWRAGFGVLAGVGPPIDAAAAAAAASIADPAARDLAQWFLGYVLTTLGDMALAGPLTAAALAGSSARGDRWGIAAAANDSVTQSMARGDVEQARADGARGAALAAELGDRWSLLQSAFALGSMAEVAGEYVRATALFADGVQMAEELGLWPEVSYQLSWLGRVALLTGELQRARELHERAMQLAVEQGFKPGEAYAQTGLALGARREGELDEAQRHLQAVLAWHRSAGFEAASSLIIAELGFVAELRGDPVAAAALQEEGLALARRFGDPRAIALALEGLAGARALAGDDVAAARLLGAATRARAAVGSPLPPAERGDVDRITDAVRAALGEEGFAVEFARDP